MATDPVLTPISSAEGYFASLFSWLYRPRVEYRWVAWLWMRGLAFVFFAAFLALVNQINALIGPEGILPAHDLLAAAAQQLSGLSRIFAVPSLLWFGSGSFAVDLIAWLGLVASVALFFNYQPRICITVCGFCFLSFLSTARDFAGYQSDGMLMGAAFISWFVAPSPRWKQSFWPSGSPAGPSWLGIFSLRWLWFTIYFDSGVMKWASHDPEWRHLTAMDHYYEYGPLPTWIGWYAQKLPELFQKATSFSVLLIEIVLAWMAFLPRRCRIVCFWIVTPLQVGIILTSNYGFLNYVVLFLGFTLLDDRHLRFLLRPLQRFIERLRRGRLHWPAPDASFRPSNWQIPGVCVLLALFLVTAMEAGERVAPKLGWPVAPQRLLEPFRIADGYALFSAMTTERYEVEFQGSNDGDHWTAYPFRFKPQDPKEEPGLYSPYQPRFEWNLWFASLGTWYSNEFVVDTEIRILQNDAAVLGLFASNPFPNGAPAHIRAEKWQYWFSTPAEKKEQGAWWTRQDLGLYAPALVLQPNGQISEEEAPRPRIPIVGSFHVPGSGH